MRAWPIDSGQASFCNPRDLAMLAYSGGSKLELGCDPLSAEDAADFELKVGDTTLEMVVISSLATLGVVEVHGTVNGRHVTATLHVADKAVFFEISKVGKEDASH